MSQFHGEWNIVELDVSSAAFMDEPNSSSCKVIFYTFTMEGGFFPAKPLAGCIRYLTIQECFCYWPPSLSNIYFEYIFRVTFMEQDEMEKLPSKSFLECFNDMSIQNDSHAQ